MTKKDRCPPGADPRAWASHPTGEHRPARDEPADLPRLLRLLQGLPGYIGEVDGEPLLVFYVHEPEAIPEYVTRAQTAGFHEGEEGGWVEQPDGITLWFGHGSMGAGNRVVVGIGPADLGASCPLCGDGADDEDEDDEDEDDGDE